MSARDIAVCVLLAVGILGFVLTAAGFLILRDFYDQIHFLAPASLAGGLAIPAAVLVHEGWSQAGAKAVLICLLLVFANPVLSHATARAGRIRRKGQLPPRQDEHFPVVGSESK